MKLLYRLICRSDYRFCYRAAFSGLAFFAFIAFFNMYYIISNHALYAELINTAGKQRLLSQKIITSAHRYLHDGDAAQLDELNKQLKSMREYHAHLIEQEMPETIHSLYFDAPTRLHDHITDFFRIAASAPEDMQLPVLVQAQEHLLIDLNHAVSLYEAQSREISNKMIWRAVVITLLTIVVLIFVSRNIFHPMFTRIDEEKEREQKLIDSLQEQARQQTRKIRESLDIINHYVFSSKTDPEGIITDVSQAFCDISGFSRDELIGKTHSLIKHPDNPSSAFSTLWRTIKEGRPYYGEVKNRSKNGENFWFDSYVYPEFDDNGEISGFVALRHNITDQKKLEALNLDLEERIKERTQELQESNVKLQELAQTDPLTKAYNRRHFEEMLQSEINRARRYDATFSIVILDIDRFKSINDTYGHIEGDRILIQIAAICKQSLRATDTFARWGGEEFTVLLPEQPLETAMHYAERLRNAIEKRHIDDLNITSSFGVAQFQSDDSPSSLLTRADNALYRAKETGRNRVVGG